MEILKRGKLPEDKTYEARCNHCKTEIRFQQREGHITHDQRDGDFITVNCPVCGNKVHTAA